jgi:hypothetical protein
VTERTRLDDVVEATEKLEAALHDGRALLKDLAAERKRIEKATAELDNAIGRLTIQHISSQVSPAIREAGNVIVANLREVADEAEARLLRRFQDLLHLALYGNSQGRGESLIDQAVRAGKKENLLLASAATRRQLRQLENGNDDA